MSGDGCIRVAQQPPAIVVRGAPFTFVAYCPQLYTPPYYGSRNVFNGQKFAYHNGFATAHVIPAADGRAASSSSPSSWERKSDIVAGKTRAEFNATNESDRTVRFEFAITRTGKFFVVVRLMRQNYNTRDEHVGSVATRIIQVVDKLDRQEDDAAFGRAARYGRLTPPPALNNLSGEEEEEESNSYYVDGASVLLEGTIFEFELPEKGNGGDSSNKRSTGRLAPITLTDWHEKNRDDGKHGEGNDESGDDGGVKLL